MSPTGVGVAAAPPLSQSDPGGFESPEDVSGLWAWYDPSQETHSDGAQFSNTGPITLTDRSSNARGALDVQASGADFTFERDHFGAGLHAARHNGSSSLAGFNLPDMSALTEGEVFVVYQLDNDPPPASPEAAKGAPIQSSANVSLSEHAPYSDGIHYSTWGHDASRTTWTTDSVDLTVGSILNIYTTAAGAHRYGIGGVWLGAEVTGVSVGLSTAPRLCRNDTAAPAQYAIDGHLGEVIIYSQVLSDTDRAAVLDYLQTKWGV